MRVTMLETRTAAPDGATVVQLLEGETYEVYEALAQSYIKRGIAQQAGEDAVPATPEAAVEEAKEAAAADEDEDEDEVEEKPKRRGRARG